MAGLDDRVVRLFDEAHQMVPDRQSLGERVIQDVVAEACDPCPAADGRNDGAIRSGVGEKVTATKLTKLGYLDKKP